MIAKWVLNPFSGLGCSQYCEQTTPNASIRFWVGNLPCNLVISWMATSWHYLFTNATTSPYVSLVTKTSALIQSIDVAQMCWPTNSKAKWSMSMFIFVIQRRWMLSRVVLIKALKLINASLLKEDWLS